jgi:iron complex outermembrane receptor protein
MASIANFFGVFMVANFNALRTCAAISASAIAFAPGLASAQTPDAAEQPAGEIVVTAQKRAERASDVPLSLSVLGGEALDAARLTQADDLAMRIPNLRFSATVGENTPIFALRGVSMSDFSLNQAGPVAVYYDEVYKGNFAFLGLALYDLQRIEVLRGPQGTLYGKTPPAARSITLPRGRCLKIRAISRQASAIMAGSKPVALPMSCSAPHWLHV